MCSVILRWVDCINSVVVFSFMFFRLLFTLFCLDWWLLLCLCLWILLIAGFVIAGLWCSRLCCELSCSVCCDWFAGDCLSLTGLLVAMLV